VLPNYLALAAMTGALWLLALAALFGARALAALVWLALALLILGAALKLGYWRFIDRSASVATAASATGLARFGKVRLLDPPHTEENYLLQEMGYRIARRHAARLRGIAALLGFVLPAALAIATPAVPPLGLLAALSASAGVLVERWLFFAEARHTVTLYYGAATA
jgi:DMSO reductase anchor subunit